MVFYFEASAGAEANYVVYMGADKFENEGLIEWGWASDVWFHVEGLSSAHVYLRVPVAKAMCDCGGDRCGCVLDRIPEETIEEMCQLVKANSIEGCKKASCMVVYTPWANLHKDETRMQTGAVGFHDSKLRRLRRCDKNRDMIKRIEKTRTEAHPDLQKQKLQFDRDIVQWRKDRDRERRADEPDAAKDAKIKARQYADFLAAGGYHAPASSSSSSARLPQDVVFGDELASPSSQGRVGGDGRSGLDAGLDSLLGALDKPAMAASSLSSSSSSSATKTALPPAPPAVFEETREPWELEAAGRAAESDRNTAWYRARGYSREAAERATAAGGTRLEALARLYQLQGEAAPAPELLEAAPAPELLEAAAEEREAEFEALEAIFGDEIDELDEKGDVALPALAAFEPEDGAPPLRFEFYSSVAPGYPLATPPLPIVAVAGGGLTELALAKITEALKARAREIAEDQGQLFFELSQLAADEATAALGEARKAREQREADALAAKRAALLSLPKAPKKNQPPNGVGEEEVEYKRAVARAKKAADAQARLGNFAEAAKSSPARTKAPPIGGGGVRASAVNDDDDDDDFLGNGSAKASSRQQQDLDDLLGVVKVAR